MTYFSKKAGDVIDHFAPTRQIANRLHFCFDAREMLFYALFAQVYAAIAQALS